MPAISTEHLVALKKILEERYVSFLPDLIAREGTLEDEKRAKQIARAFNAFVVQKYFDTSAQEAASSVVDNYNDNGIDAVFYNAKTKCLALVQSKLHKSQDFGQSEAQDFEAGITLFLNQQFDTFNQNVKDRLSDIEHYLDECDEIKLVVACTGNQISAHARTRLNNFASREEKEDERLSANVVYLEADKVSDYLVKEQSIPSITARIRIEKSTSTTSSRRMVHGMVAIRDLVDLHKLHNKALYEKNIRYFIGSKKSDVNTAIKKTLENQPGEFIYLNNGITALCDKLNPKNPNSKSHTHEAVGLSIVNGAQTIASSAEFVEQNPTADISSAKVMFTLIHAPDVGGFHKEVTKARNFQNPVHISNFISLDEQQEEIRKSLKLHGYNYHYRPEAITMREESNSISVEDAIIALACMLPDPRHPIWLKSDVLQYRDQDSSHYNTVFGDNVSAYKLINAVKCYRLLRTLATENEQRTDSQQERLIYRHGVFVLCSLLMKRLKERICGDTLVDVDEIKTLISEPFDSIRQVLVDEISNGGNGPLALFRNLSYGTPLVQKLMKQQATLNEAEQQVAETLGNTLDPLNPEVQDQYRNMRLITFLLSKTSQL